MDNRFGTKDSQSTPSIIRNSWQHAFYAYFPNKEEQEHRKPVIHHLLEQAPPPPARRDPGWDDTSNSDFEDERTDDSDGL